MNKNNKNNNSKPAYVTINLAEVQTPKIDLNRVKSSNTEWVTYGEKNDFPAQLVGFSKKGTTHKSLVSTRQKLIASEGFTYSDNIKPFLENLDEEGTTVNDWLESTAVDLSVLETFAAVVRYNSSKDKIIAIDYLDSSTVRPSKTLDEFGKVQGYWLCADWSNVNQNKPVYYEKFNPRKVKQTTQIYFFHKKALLQPYLPEVSYLGALNSIELEYELSVFGLSTVHNGFFGSALVSVKANMNEDEKSMFANNLKNTFTGAGNASKMMVVIDDNDKTVSVTPLSANDNTNMLNTLKNFAKAEICTAHQANPIIAAIATDGSTLGSDGKLYRDSLEIYNNTVIRDFQKPIISFLDKVLKFNGYTDYELEITSNALLASALPIEYKADYLKPEVWLADFGYTKEDIKPELLEAIEEAESESEVEKIIEENKPDELLDNPTENV